MVLKEVLCQRGLNQPWSGGLSSYSLINMMITVLQRAEVERARARRIVACTHAAALAAAAARGGRQVPRPLPAAGAAAAVLPLSPLLPTQVGVAHPSGVLGPLIPPPPPPLPLPLTPLQSPGRGVVVGMPGSEYTGRGQDLRQDARFSGPNGEVVVNAVAMTGSAAAPDQQGLAVDGGRATAVPARVGGERMALSAAHGVAPGTTPNVSPTVTPSATPYVVPSTATGASGDGGPVVSLDEDASAVSLGGGCAAAAVTCSAGKVLANGDCYGGAEIAARVEDSRDGGKRQPPLVANNRSDRQQQQQQQQSLAALGGAQEGLLPQGEHRIAVAAAATAGGSGGADGEAGVAMRGDGVSEAANVGDVGDHLNLSDAPHPHSRHASHGEGDPVAPAGPAVAVLSPGAANQGMYPAPLQQPGGGGGAHMQGALLPPPALPLAAQRSIDMNADLFHMKHMEITLSPEEVERADLSGMTPGEVLVRFLSFFGRQFDASRLGISVGRGALNNPFALSPAVDPRTGMPVMDAHVVIEDPLDREQNVARSCFGFPQVQWLFGQCLSVLQERGAEMAEFDRDADLLQMLVYY